MNPGRTNCQTSQGVQLQLCCAVQCRLKPRLEAMAEHYCSSSSTGISRLLERMKQVGQLYVSWGAGWQAMQASLPARQCQAMPPWPSAPALLLLFMRGQLPQLSAHLCWPGPWQPGQHPAACALHASHVLPVLL